MLMMVLSLVRWIKDCSSFLFFSFLKVIRGAGVEYLQYPKSRCVADDDVVVSFHLMCNHHNLKLS